MLRYGCPFEVYTGRWRQETVYAAKGVVRAAAHKRMEARDFARQVRAEQLYAVYGSYYERGGQPYWLLWCRKAPYKAMPGLKYPDGSQRLGPAHGSSRHTGLQPYRRADEATRF